MKILKFDQLNELSKELIDKTANIMTSRGQYSRANNLVDTYNKVTYDFSEFVDKPIFGDEFVVNIVMEHDRLIKIYVSNKKEFNTSHHQVTYYIPEDKWVDIPHKNRVSRKDVRMLGKIASIVNPETQYRTGSGDIEIGEY